MITSARTLVIVLPSWVGDTVMATPAMRAVRAAMPGGRIVAVTRPGLDALLDGSPWIDELAAVDSTGATGVWRWAEAVRRMRPDAALLLPNSFKSALAVRLARVPCRAGYGRDGRSWLLSDPVRCKVSKRPVSAVDHYADLVAALGIPVTDRRMELFVSAAQMEAGERMLRDVDRPFALLNPGGNRADKRWPAERFAAVADALASKHGLAVVLNGSPGERPVLDALKSASRTPLIDLSLRGVTLGSLKAVVKRAALLVTNDTGPRHLAAALGTPVVTLFGPTDHRWTTLHGARERLLLAEPFLPEELVADKHPKACAVERISVPDVITAAEAMLIGRS